MRIGKGLLGALVAVSAATMLPLCGFAQDLDILRSVPLEISGYAVAKSFPARFATSDQVLSAIDSSPNLLIHMEALRRAYHDLDATESEKVLAALFKRHQLDEKDLMKGFNHGYAQLVFKRNKTGLFFLRKANDKFQDQFSSLAYGMAEAEADLNNENASPDELNMRKLDVTFQLSDAVKRDATSHQPGFWPSYMRAVEKLKAVSAYNSFTKKDFSLVYVPYGNSVIPLHGATVTSIPLKADSQALLSNALRTSCDPNDAAQTDEPGAPTGAAVASRAVDFNGSSAMIQFFNTDVLQQYRVRVTAADGRPMLSFRTYTLPHIVEDLDGDGTFEIVARQYKYDPMHPVLVYRYTPCGFELDKKVFDEFQ